MISKYLTNCLSKDFLANIGCNQQVSLIKCTPCRNRMLIDQFQKTFVVIEILFINFAGICIFSNGIYNHSNHKEISLPLETIKSNNKSVLKKNRKTHHEIWHSTCFCVQPIQRTTFIILHKKAKRIGWYGNILIAPFLKKKTAIKELLFCNSSRIK